MKCELCGKEIDTTFLNKPNGNYVRVNGKLHVVCSDCFRKYKDKVKETLSKGP